MNSDTLDMDEVTVELPAETVERLEDIAFREHRDNRDAAVRELLDEWLKRQD